MLFRAYSRGRGGRSGSHSSYGENYNSGSSAPAAETESQNTNNVSLGSSEGQYNPPVPPQPDVADTNVNDDSSHHDPAAGGRGRGRSGYYGGRSSSDNFRGGRRGRGRFNPNKSWVRTPDMTSGLVTGR